MDKSPSKKGFVYVRTSIRAANALDSMDIDREFAVDHCLPLLRSLDGGPHYSEASLESLGTINSDKVVEFMDKFCETIKIKTIILLD
jgi:hypothetical protein